MLMKVSLQELKEKSGIGFGTSGIRGLITDLTDFVCYSYTKAFVEFLRQKNDLSKGRIAIAGDLRDSTGRIMKTVARAIGDEGIEVINCGFIPTPAVTYYGTVRGVPTVMITGSHIPNDRNGIKYNLSTREIIKEEEEVISGLEIEVEENLFDGTETLKEAGQLPEIKAEAEDIYKKRYLDFFEADLLTGKKIGLYGHSAVGREIIEDVLKKLGAEVIRLEFSDTFVPVDTEAIEEDLVKKGREWSKEYNLEAIVTTDGDSDRPLLADENGEWLRADTSGIPVARFLGAKTAVVPVSCNTALEKSGVVKRVERVRVGSPYVVAKMVELMAEGETKVVGYEANGGFLAGEGFARNGKVIKQLLTRDALIVLLSLLAGAEEKNISISELIADLPKRFTGSGSIKDFATDLSLKKLEELGENKEKIGKALGNDFGEIAEINSLDGLRVTFENGRIVHLRPSRNAPEFRNYTEAESQTEAEKLVKMANKLIERWREEKA